MYPYSSRLVVRAKLSGKLLSMKTFYLNCIESGHDLLAELLESGIIVDHIITLTPEQAEKHKVSG